MIETIK